MMQANETLRALRQSWLDEAAKLLERAKVEPSKIVRAAMVARSGQLHECATALLVALTEQEAA